MFFVLVASAIKNMKHVNVLLFYGKNTMFILCTHYFILRLIGDASRLIIGKNLWRMTSTPKSLLLLAPILVFYYFAIRFYKKQFQRRNWFNILIGF